MNALSVLKLSATVVAGLIMLWFFYHRHPEELSLKTQIKLACIGFVANFFDTIGIGSFATIVALRKILGVMPDDLRLIGSMNIQAMVTALVQALIFLQFIPLDIPTLLIAVLMIGIGGGLSGLIAVHINVQLVRRVMLIAFIVTGILLFLSQLNILAISGNGRAISGIRLIIFSLFMLIAGALPAFGVGYYSLVKASIFLFGVNPVIAFPIMATASAFQMPITSATFISKQKFYYKSTILLAGFGVIGVLLAFPIINLVNTYTLKWILFAVVVYNVMVLLRNTNSV